MRGFIADRRARELWKRYSEDPGSVERQYHAILNEYTEKFHHFFQGYWPISLHAHVSDVLVPTTLATLILNTASTSPLVIESPELSPMLKDDPEPEKIQDFVRNLLGWTDVHVTSPRFAVVEGIYGGAFGPLALVSSEWEYNIIGTGQAPVVIRKEDLSPDILLEKLILAKQRGCMACFPPEVFTRLQRACHQAKLFLVVDEAMTAIRCGAPWACQRPEYSQGDLKPDLVVFGKGLCVSGASINFDGAMMKSLGFNKKSQMLQSIRFWRALTSRPVALPVLIEALGILNMAQAEDWPARSDEIEKAIKTFVRDHAKTFCEDDEPVRGLGAMIAVKRDVSAHFRVMAAIRRRSPWVRWLPKLDSAAGNRKALDQYIMGSETVQAGSNYSFELPE
ncbi:uncharacterized protein N7477_002494 [Penicillium maclennaniae]|uniref:uncharacterized protein n=1 Tax=Penicillium maclennaniae TaxID=1343394 RepID=UPI00253FD071|nr:uncharacterized protein N7477_002494 [Penicillium maclennaniae]KAJ5676861.1 hypothetical protein N7477_002494 [Penicillium maclennaniae]